MDPQAPGYAGFKDYSPTVLRIYDWWVLGVMAKRVWKAPVRDMVTAMERVITGRHLDVGPGTAYLLAEANLPASVEITLLDPNPHVLAHSADRLSTHRVETVQANVLEPLPVDGAFDSAALSNVLHCLPGPITAKASAVRHIADVLSPDGVLVGSTVLGPEHEDHGRAARTFIRMANRQGGFDNLHDSVDGLHRILKASFNDVAIECTGSMALFEAWNPSQERSSL